MAVSSNTVRLTEEDLESIIERALEEARARGASQAEAAVSQDTGLSVGVRLGEVGNPGTPARSQHGNHGLFWAAQGFGQHGGFLAGCGPGDCGQGLQYRPIHGGRRLLRGLADAELMMRTPLDLDLSHPWNVSADRAIEIAKSLQAAALYIRRADQQFRGRIGRHASGSACLREYPWFRGRLSDHIAYLELRRARGYRRRNAT